MPGTGSPHDFRCAACSYPATKTRKVPEEIIKISWDFTQFHGDLLGGFVGIWGVYRDTTLDIPQT